MHRMKSWTLAAAVGFAACRGSATEPSTAVNFVIVAPLCSSVIPVEFTIDSRTVGTDTFRVAVSAPRTVSRNFSVTPGQHFLGARVVDGYAWSPQAVFVASGTVVSDSLPFYCS